MDGGARADSSVARHFLRRGRGAEFEMEAAWVRDHLPSDGGRVVDLGCGNGSLFSVIGSGRVTGVDGCADGLTHTRARNPGVPLLCADAVCLPFADSSVDAVTAQHLIEHLVAYEQACGEWLRILRPGGVLLVLTPNSKFSEPGVFQDETHQHLFDARDLQAVLTGAGFTIVDSRTIGLPWFREYHSIPSGWRLRRFVTRRAGLLSTVPWWRWRGQTLCYAARRPW